MFCPVCKSEISGDAENCPICGSKIDAEDKSQWVVLGTIDEKYWADYAKETLATYEIPSIIFSKSGFFGNIGIQFTPFFKQASSSFEISIMKDDVEEAVEILNTILNDKWHRKD